MTSVVLFSIIGAVSLLLVVDASAASRPTSCGYVNPSEYHVEIEKGQVPCKEARKVIITVIRGNGTRHGNTKTGLAGLYWTVPGGWGCVTGTGGVWSCARGGSESDPKEMIYAVERVEEEAMHGA
jgi:hypothetical protein